MRRTSVRVLAISTGLAAMSLLALGYPISELAGGIRDVPRHWWSAPALAALVVSGTVFVKAWAPRR